MKDMTISIMGTEYAFYIGNEEQFPELRECDGYTDTTIKLIVIDDLQKCKDELDSKKDIESYQKQVARHEVLHAFLYESGLDNNTFIFSAWAANEEIVDWFAIQFPKIHKVYTQLGIE